MKTEEKKTGELVHMSEATHLPATPVNECDIFHDPNGAGASWNTLDMTDPKHLMLLQKIGNEATTNIDSYINRQFRAVHAFINRWSKTDEQTGEYVQGLRCTFIDKDGGLLSFTGGSAIRCVQRLAANPCIGLPPWKDGLLLNVGQVTNNGRRRHTLEVPEDEFARLIAQHTARHSKPRK
jgi:hypothetical protein